MISQARALWLTARPKTLSAAVVPVLVGTTLVVPTGHEVALGLAFCALLSAVFIQIGTNFINDAMDFIKGADNDARLGEARATHQGWFTERQVLSLGVGSFLLALILGIPLVVHGGWPIFLIGILSLCMGVAYTAGPFPLAYLGLGDVFVLIFFGLVAVGGVYFLESGMYTLSALVAGLQVGLLATVMIAINNLRDLNQDRLVNKKTLAVRLGARWGRIEVVALIVAAFALNYFWFNKGDWWAAGLPFLVAPHAFTVAQTLLRTQASREYNQLLARAALVHLMFGLLLSLGFVLK